MALSYGALAFLGFVVGVVGTSGHRYQPYWGSAVVIGLVISAGVFARAWRSWGGYILFGLACLGTVQFLYYVRSPGGSIVILGDLLGQVWMYGGAIAAAIPAFVPGRFVNETVARGPSPAGVGEELALGRMGGSNPRSEEIP